MCVLCEPGLISLGALRGAVAWERILACRQLPVPGSIAPFATRSEPVSTDEAKLVEALARGAEKGHTDIRIELGAPYRPKAWPRSSLDASLWTWKAVGSWKWDQAEHINALEARALLTAIKRRTRSSRSQHSRFLVLCDSKVVCAIVAKGKSSSLKLSSIIRKINTTLLATRSYVVCAFVSSEDNPADKPSRWPDFLLPSRPDKRGRKDGKPWVRSKICWSTRKLRSSTRKPFRNSVFG